MCLGAMLAARVRRLVFGAPDPKGGACVSLYRLPEDPRLNHRLEVTGGAGKRSAGRWCRRFFRPGDIMEGRFFAALLGGAGNPHPPTGNRL